MTEELQEGRLAGAILADDADDITLLYLKIDVLERPDIVAVALGSAVVGLTNLKVRVFFTEDGGLPPAVEIVTKGASADTAKSVLLADVTKFNCYVFIHFLGNFYYLFSWEI